MNSKLRARQRRRRIRLPSSAQTYALLLRLFEQVANNPDAFPVVPVADFPAGSPEHELMASLDTMLTRLLKSKEALRQSEERYNLAIQGATDGLWDWDLRSNAVYYSPRWKSMLGYDEHEVEDNFDAWVALVHPEDREQATSAINDYLDGKTQQYRLEHRLRHKDGSYRWIVARGVALREPSGKPYRMAGSHADVTRRKEAEEAHRLSDARFRALVDQSPFAIQRYSPDGKHIQINKAALSLWNIDQNDVDINETFQILEDEQLRASGLTPYVERMFAGEVTEIPAFYYDSSFSPTLEGHERWIRMVGFPVRDEEGNILEIVIIMEDVTSQKTAEQDLRKSEARFRALFEQSPYAIQRHYPDGRVLHYNQPAFDIWGITEAHLEGYNILQDEQLAKMGLMPYIERGFAGEITTVPPIWYDPSATTSLPAGPVRWVSSMLFPVKDEAGKILEVVVLLDDITEQKMAQDALREKEEQYRSIFEATSDGILISDPEGRVVEANPAFCRMQGYSYDELIGIKSIEFLHPDYHEKFRHSTDLMSEHGQVQAQVVNVRRDGSTFPVEVHASTFTYKGQRYNLAVIRDITEQQQAYQLLEERVEERTRELTTLLEVSHNVASTLELKPLLGLILGQLRKMVDYMGAAVYTLDGEEPELLDYAGPLTQERYKDLPRQMKQVGVFVEAIRTHEPVIIADVWGDSPLARNVQGVFGDDLRVGYVHLRSWMGIPLMVKERVVGLISFTHSEPNYFTPRHARLALAIGNQAAVAIENARYYEQAQGIAALEERQRLARELHDSVSQAIFSISLHASTASTLLTRNPDKVAEPIDHIRSLAQAAMAEMRALIFELRPESLENEGLVAALTKQVAATRVRHYLDVSAQLCAEPDLPLDVKEAIYRIAQESLHNIVKHARASRIDISLNCEDGFVTLELQDNGVGFDTSGQFPGHLGLHSMRERATRFGGTFTIESSRGHGTRTQVRIPAHLD
jgi:PAS domain S-box-containing protein